MRWYLGLSLFLHGLIFAIFLYRRMEPIDEPIVAVSLGLNPNQNKISAAPQTKRVANPQLQQPQKNIQVEAKESAHEVSKQVESSATAAYESGNVSVKPKVMKQIQVVYPQQAKEARVEGPVKLSVLINESGAVGDVTVLEGPGFGLDEAAREALKQFIFSPAEVLGQKVPVRIVYVYRFKLESR